MERFFDVRQLETSQHWKDLREQEAGKGSEHSSVVETFEYIRECGAKSCIVERQYVDADYRNEFAALYGKAHLSYSNLCTRLLFFRCSKDKTQSNLHRIGRIAGEYLGFVVLRPPEVGKIGRTLLEHPCQERDRHNCYTVCTGSIPVHVGSRELPTKGAPYISQDSMVMTCAECAIWVTTSLMSPQLGHRHTFPHEITLAALHETGWTGRPLPSAGLVTQQMLNALVKLGYNPIFHLPRPTRLEPNQPLPAEFPREWDAFSLIYPYIESGIPVIALVPYHAVTVIGHLSDWSTSKPSYMQWFENSLQSDVGPAVACLSSHSWASGLLVQDDNIGPYSVLPADHARASDFMGTWWERLLVGNRYMKHHLRCPYSSVGDIEGIIVPLPDKVYFTAENCISATMGLLRTLAGDRLTFDEKGLAQWRRAIPEIGSLVDGLNRNTLDPAVIRLYLARSSDYKASLPSRMKALPGHIRRRLLETHMPRYIWVAELSTKSLFNPPNRDSQALGEIVFDCTANTYASHPWVVLHLPGLLVQQTRTQDFPTTPYKEAASFRIYTRPDIHDQIHTACR